MKDSGATGEAFLDESFAQRYNLTMTKLDQPLRLRVVDGRDSSAGSITHSAQLQLQLGDHKEQILCYVTKLGQYDMILGHPWLRRHNPHCDYEQGSVTFFRDFCKTYCLPSHVHQYTVRGISHPSPECSNKSLPKPAHPRRVGAAAFDTLSRQHGVQIFSTTVHEINKLLGGPSDPSYENKESTLLDTDSHADRCTTASNLYLNGASIEDIRKALQPKIIIDPTTKLPKHYHEFLPVFDQQEADKLPPHRECDHKIELLPGKLPPAGPLYSMSEDELLVLRKFLEENLSKGFIRASSSPAASPVLFAKKPGGGLRFCVDYRALNAITIKNRYPLPLIQETLARLSRAKFYTKLDVIAAFNRIRIAEGQEYLTAFNTRYGLFETLVMPFGLSNAPATFQARINEILHPYLDVFCTAYIDDILVYSDDLLEHREHVKKVLRVLQDAGLQLDIKKCEFEVTEVTYLGLILSTEGVRMDPAKVKCITDWESPANVKDVQAFLGFANFYRRFIQGFSRIVRSLVSLTRKDMKFLWSLACEKAFATLKTAFTTAPTLHHFDPLKEIFVETDASDYVSSGVLSQKDKHGVLHPVAFMSKKYNPAECNYEIYDKELLAIVRCFEGWRPELQGAHYPIHVLTDHRNLEYFMTTKQLTRRQVR
jgi:RNase H-like domain found in reverse transcriptase/Reverse transcriptase (RNA-dependent DNA polymerase)/Retroviral aspartyl protease